MIERTLLGGAVVIGESLRDAGTRIAAQAPAHVFAVITDEHVAGLPHLEILTTSLRAASRQRIIQRVIPAGEGSKTRELWMELSDWLLGEDCGRDTTVVALGGGVVGDLAGFVAATFMRGIPVVQVPTTLLAMVDAALGGKTGVDTPAGKNLIGAFHHPELVCIDPSVIRTLPVAHVRAGMAEVLKHGVIADSEYFRHAADLAAGLAAGQLDAAWWESTQARDLIARSIEIKSGVVSQDARENGRRESLNFGHTVAHAVEAALHYTLLHGDAVAIGMVAEASLGESLGLTSPGTRLTLERTLNAAGLPTRLPAGLSPSAVVAAAAHDKKARAGRLRIAVPQSLGVFAPRDGAWSVAVADTSLEASLQALVTPPSSSAKR